MSTASLASAEEYRLKEILAIFVRWRKLALMAFFCVLVPGVLVTLLMPPMFEASAILLVDRPTISPSYSVKSNQVGEASPILRNVNREEEVKTVAETIRTREVIEASVTKLDMDMAALTRIRDFRRYVQAAIDGVLDSVKWFFRELKYLTGFSKRPTPEETAFAEREKFLDTVGERLRVVAVPDTNILRVSFRSSDPVLAQSAINTIVTEFVDGKQREVQDIRVLFAEELRLEAERLHAAEATLAEFQRDRSAYSVATQRDLLLQSQERLRAEIAQAEALHAQKSAAVGALRKRLWSDPRLSSQVNVKLVGAEVDLEGVKAELESLRRSLQDNAQLLSSNNDAGVRLRELEREVARSEGAFSLRQRNFEQARATESMTGAAIRNVRIVDLAAYPLTPIRPRTLLYLGIAIGAALLAAIALPFLAHLNDITLASERDASRLLGLPLVVSIPLIKDLPPTVDQRTTNRTHASGVVPAQ